MGGDSKICDGGVLRKAGENAAGWVGVKESEGGLDNAGEHEIVEAVAEVKE